MLADVSHRVAESVSREEARPEGIHREVVDDVLVLSPQGGLDAAVVDELSSAVRAATSPVLIDLNDCIVVDPHLLRSSRLRRELRAARDVCIACRRLTARRLLARTSVLEHVAVFQSVQDALQARVLQRDGYGSGWLSA